MERLFMEVWPQSMALNGIPNMIIDRFEVIKGPSSTLYGSEAVAGVINIITKNPETQPALSIDIMTSTHEEVFGNFILMPPKMGKIECFCWCKFWLCQSLCRQQSQTALVTESILTISLIFTKINFNRPSEQNF